MLEERKVLGHTCEGLKEHFKYASDSGCIPRLNTDGSIAGCDDTNTVKIKYCPYCGDKLT